MPRTLNHQSPVGFYRLDIQELHPLPSTAMTATQVHATITSLLDPCNKLPNSTCPNSDPQGFSRLVRLKLQLHRNLESFFKVDFWGCLGGSVC